MVIYKFTKKDCEEWLKIKEKYYQDPKKHPLRNPVSKRKIQEGKSVWKKLESQCKKFNICQKIIPRFRSRYIKKFYQIK